MVGNIADATKVVMNGTADNANFWGSTRNVYLIDNVVYKVADNDEDNLAEYDKYVWLKNNSDIFARFDNIALPDTSIYCVGDTFVIAMEFIDGVAVGECFCVSDEEHNETCLDIDIVCAIRSMGVEDTNYGNIILKDSIYYLVDIAI